MAQGKLLVRIRVQAKCKTYTIGSTIFHKDKGWYTVDAGVVPYLKTALTNPADPDSLPVFESITPAELQEQIKERRRKQMQQAGFIPQGDPESSVDFQDEPAAAPVVIKASPVGRTRDLVGPGADLPGVVQALPEPEQVHPDVPTRTSEVVKGEVDGSKDWDAGLDEVTLNENTDLGARASRASTPKMVEVNEKGELVDHGATQDAGTLAEAVAPASPPVVKPVAKKRAPAKAKAKRKAPAKRKASITKG